MKPFLVRTIFFTHENFRNRHQTSNMPLTRFGLEAVNFLSGEKILCSLTSILHRVIIVAMNSTQYPSTIWQGHDKGHEWNASFPTMSSGNLPALISKWLKRREKYSRQRYLWTLCRRVVRWRCTTRFRPAYASWRWFRAAFRYLVPDKSTFFPAHAQTVQIILYSCTVYTVCTWNRSFCVLSLDVNATEEMCQFCWQAGVSTGSWWKTSNIGAMDRTYTGKKNWGK